MRHLISHLGFCGVSLCWVLVWLLPVPLWGVEPQQAATAEIMHGTDFVLTRQGDQFSLRAQQASLRDIVKTLGTMLAIEVVSRMPRDPTVTLDVAGLSLPELLERLRTFANIVYLTETTQPASTITRMFVLPIHSAQSIAPHMVPGGTAPPPPPGSSPEPFKFTFDPSTHKEGQR